MPADPCPCGRADDKHVPLVHDLAAELAAPGYAACGCSPVGYNPPVVCARNTEHAGTCMGYAVIDGEPVVVPPAEAVMFVCRADDSTSHGVTV